MKKTLSQQRFFAAIKKAPPLYYTVMAAQVAPRPPLFPFPSDHLEQVSRAVSAITIDPFRNTLYYLFPLIGAYFNAYQELRSDPSQEAMMPQAPTVRILEEVQNLTGCAGIQRKVIPYVCLNYQFAYCGGPYSLTSPLLLLPDQHLFRRDGKSPFAQERPDERLRENRWVFSDDETRFLIARELGQIKENSILLRVAVKVAVAVALFTMYTMPLGLLVGFAIFIGVLGIYVISERKYQGRSDIIAAEILGRRINNPRRAFQVAIDALEKQRRQNLYRRENSLAARLYTTATGNNVLDFLHHYLTTRIEVLRECERNL
jgi:hypothetical protein